jgi:hypothetical protein
VARQHDAIGTAMWRPEGWFVETSSPFIPHSVVTW